MAMKNTFFVYLAIYAVGILF